MTEEEYNEVRELAGDCVEMLVSVGIIDSISPRWPEEVIDRWHDRIRSIRRTVNRMTAEVQEFASAWDNDSADE